MLYSLLTPHTRGTFTIHPPSQVRLLQSLCRMDSLRHKLIKRFDKHDFDSFGYHRRDASTIIPKHPYSSSSVNAKLKPTELACFPRSRVIGNGWGNVSVSSFRPADRLSLLEPAAWFCYELGAPLKIANRSTTAYCCRVWDSVR
jgi:hypothetical protein